jgi:hypothetical protein
VSTDSTTGATVGLSMIKKIPSLGMEFLRAEDEIRTRDPHLGKVMLYQLSYFRMNGVSVGLQRYGNLGKPGNPVTCI